MPIISNDPSWWPLINATRIGSYFIGLWRASRTIMMVSDVVYDHAVAAFAGVMYDWGEQDSITQSHWYLVILALTLAQEVGICHEQTSHLAEICFIDWAGLGEHSSTLEEQLLIRDRGNAGRSWPFCISVYVACIGSVVRELCWLEVS